MTTFNKRLPIPTIVEANDGVLPLPMSEDNMRLTKNIRDAIWMSVLGAVALEKAEAAAVAPMTSVEAQTVAVPTEPQRWSAVGVDPALLPIARLESNFGANVDHVKHPKGEWWTAFGPLGFKPMTAHDELMHSPALLRLYPELQDPVAFIKKFQEDTRFYNVLANHHFNRLIQMFGEHAKAVFAWRWGQGATIAATPEQIAADPYVQAYFRITSALAAR